VLEQVADRRPRDRLDGHVQPRFASRERLHQGRDVLGDDARDRHLHEARLSLAGVHRAPGLLREAQDLGRQGRQAPPPRGQRDPAAAAHEQLVAELLAKRRDRHRHGRLGDAELAGGRLDRAKLGDEHEGLQLGEGHLLA
jgi:hypothetical protein